MGLYERMRRSVDGSSGSVTVAPLRQTSSAVHECPEKLRTERYWGRRVVDTPRPER